MRVSKAFRSFNRRPIGAASLGQVHKAALRDGRLVAVKVLRPGVRARAIEDRDVIGLAWVSRRRAFLHHERRLEPRMDMISATDSLLELFKNGDLPALPPLRP